MRKPSKPLTLKAQLKQFLFRRDLTIDGFDIETPVKMWYDGPSGLPFGQHTGEVIVRINARQKAKKVKTKKKKK
jgi:hypothetical protein